METVIKNLTIKPKLIKTKPKKKKLLIKKLNNLSSSKMKKKTSYKNYIFVNSNKEDEIIPIDKKTVKKEGIEIKPIDKYTKDQLLFIIDDFKKNNTDKMFQKISKNANKEILIKYINDNNMK